MYHCHDAMLKCRKFDPIVLGSGFYSPCAMYGHRKLDPIALGLDFYSLCAMYWLRKFDPIALGSGNRLPVRHESWGY